MNPEITKLQILNDLIAQTLDVLTQRNLMAQRAAMFGGGFAHSPYNADPRLGGYGVDPRVGGGFSHSPYAQDPRLAMQGQLGNIPGYGIDPRLNMGFGLNHSPYAQDPRLAMQGQLGNIPGYGIDPRLGVQQWGWTGGLSHTGIDPRFSPHGVGAAHAIGFGPQSYNVWPQQNWNIGGLQHTPYVDPRLAYDPRLAFTGGAAQPMTGMPGIDPRTVYGLSPYGI